MSKVDLRVKRYYRIFIFAEQRVNILMSRYINVWKRWTDFTGRSNRREFWWFMIWHLAVLGVCALLDGVYFFRVLSFIYMIISVIPLVSVSIRRLNDAGYSYGHLFFILVPVIGWVFLLFFLLQKQRK